MERLVVVLCLAVVGAEAMGLVTPNSGGGGGALSVDEVLSSTLTSAESRSLSCEEKLSRILRPLCANKDCPAQAHKRSDAPPQPLSLLFRYRRAQDDAPNCCAQRCTYRQLNSLCCP